MRTLLTIGYCALLTLLVAVFWARERKDQAYAAQALPANHLLQPGDLILQADARSELLVGRYLASAKARGATIGASDVNVVPTLEPRQGGLQLLVGVDRTLVTTGTVNAGTTVHLCIDKKAVPETLVPRLTVSALLCPGAASAPCLAVASLPAAAAASAAAALSAASAAAARPIAATCG
jgi:hypothetical protein